MSLKYEPSSEPLHIYVKQLFLNSEQTLNALDVACTRWSHLRLQGYLAHKKPPHLEGENKAGRTALMMAAGRGHDAAMRALLEAGKTPHVLGGGGFRCVT